MRPRVLLAALVALAALGAPRRARADWQVHRGASSALRERAEQALRERPDDDELARRLVHLAGRRGQASLIGRFRDRAERDPTYASVAAYARLLLALGDASAAAKAFDAVLRVAPGSAPAWEGRARALMQAADASGALTSYDGALRLEQRPGPRRRLLEAELTILAGRGPAGPFAPVDRARTVTLRRELTRLDPDGDGAAMRLADALEQTGQRGEAAAALEARLQPGRTVDKLPLALRAARLRLADGQPPDADRAAAAIADLARQLGPGDSEQRREVWSMALSAARRRGTLEELAHDIARLGDRAGAAEWDALGQARDELGDLEGALGATREAVAHAPRDPDLARRLAALLDRLGREDEATLAYVELARRNPFSARFAVELIERQMRRGHREAASAGLGRTIARFAGDRGALFELASVASRFGDQEQALAAWQRLHRLAPTDDSAIVGLGEAQFQCGRKDEARRTWAALVGRGRVPATSHLAFAGVLLEHDFVTEATDEARRAQALDPHSVAPHRLLAQIFEREKRIDDAITEWNVVLGLGTANSGEDARARSEQTALRREARVRLLGLFSRQGRGRSESQIRRLVVEAQAHPDDGEATLFLAEAQERAGDLASATSTLRNLLDRTQKEQRGLAGGDAFVEAAFGLVHLLKRSGQLDEAVFRLDGIVRMAPGRAREAELQLADIALERYETSGALGHAARAAAAAGADGLTLARVAEIQSRAGADALAIASYREAMAHEAGPVSALALVRLLERNGDPASATAVLQTLLRQPSDDETLSEAGRLATDLGELSGTLADVEQRLTDELAVADTPARRRALVAVLGRLLPPIYRDQGGDEARARLGRRVLRVLLELATDAQQSPDGATLELTGMLGDGDAAPALARIALLSPSTSQAKDAAPRAEVRLAAVIALGRLGDRRGLGALEHLAQTADPNLRAAAVWALGRVDDERVLPTLLSALDDRRPDVTTAACLGLGHRGGNRAVTALASIATDAQRASGVRRAAIIGLGHAAARGTTPLLFRLLDAGDVDLAGAAALALAWSRDPEAIGGLLVRALLPRLFGLTDGTAPLSALSVATGAQPADEARMLSSARFDLDGALGMLTAPQAHRDLTPLLREHAQTIQNTIDEALSRGGDGRVEALEALDALDTRGNGLGPGDANTNRDEARESETGGSEGSPEGAVLLREIARPLADRLLGLVADSEVEIQAAALRVLAKLGDQRVTPARIAEAAAEGSPALAAAAAFAALRAVRERPGSASAIVAAVSPSLGDKSWQRRLGAVETLAVLGVPALNSLEQVRGDKNAIVRSAALEALSRQTIDLPAPPSRMP